MKETKIQKGERENKGSKIITLKVQQTVLYTNKTIIGNSGKFGFSCGGEMAATSVAPTNALLKKNHDTVCF